MPLASLIPIGIASGLNIWVLFLLARGPLRRFPFAFLFCAAQLLVTLSDTLAFLRFGYHAKLYFQWYWAGDLFAHLCISLLILALARQALQGRPSANRVTAALLGGMLLILTASLVSYYSPQLNRWMTPVSRNLSFGEEILNFVLWALVLEKRDYDRQFLIVSAGIGIQVTGEVIGHTLRIYAARSLVWLPNLLVLLCEALCLLIWIAAFRQKGSMRANA